MARRSTIGSNPLGTGSASTAPRTPTPAAGKPAAASAASASPSPSSSSAASRPAPPAAPQPDGRESRALAIVQSHVGWSAAAGFVPIPWVDFAAIVALHLKMLRDVSAVYGQRFDADLTRPTVVALITSGGSWLLSWPAAALLRVIPVIGPLASFATLPAFSAASCYATGKVFIQHFESGGTLLDFKPEKMRAYYAEQLATARKGLPV